MFKIFDSNSLQFNDLMPVDYGSQDCEKGHYFGPYERNYHLIHFVTDGCGTLEIKNKTYNVSSGEMFYIPPKITSFYKADITNPWKYSWIGIRGILADSYFKKSGLSEKKPVTRFSEELFAKLGIFIKSSSIDCTARSIGYLYLFIDELIKCSDEKDKYKSSGQLYAEAAVKYINENLYEKVTVSQIANLIGIDCSYLCSLFKKYFACSPQQYILKNKISAAKNLLSQTPYEIKYIASLIGYDDPFTFSHIFKSYTGLSPKAWRNQNKE